MGAVHIVILFLSSFFFNLKLIVCTGDLSDLKKLMSRPGAYSA